MIDRRHLLFAALSLPAAALPALGSSRAAGAAGMSRITAYAFTFTALDGGTITLAEHAGHPMLVVNTASQCGYTPQYSGLQALWTRFGKRGLFLLGVPSNDFGGQEPGGATDIEATAKGEFHVTFPLAGKASVTGPNAHPFYKWAAAERPFDRPRWNFHKYLVGRGGMLKAGFASAMEPADPLIISAIETELG